MRFVDAYLAEHSFGEFDQLAIDEQLDGAAHITEGQTSDTEGRNSAGDGHAEAQSFLAHRLRTYRGRTGATPAPGLFSRPASFVYIIVHLLSRQHVQQQIRSDLSGETMFHVHDGLGAADRLRHIIHGQPHGAESQGFGRILHQGSGHGDGGGSPGHGHVPERQRLPQQASRFHADVDILAIQHEGRSDPGLCREYRIVFHGLDRSLDDAAGLDEKGQHGSTVHRNPIRFAAVQQDGDKGMQVGRLHGNIHGNEGGMRTGGDPQGFHQVAPGREIRFACGPQGIRLRIANMQGLTMGEYRDFAGGGKCRSCGRRRLLHPPSFGLAARHHLVDDRRGKANRLARYVAAVGPQQVKEFFGALNAKNHLAEKLQRPGKQAFQLRLVKKANVGL